MYAAVRAGFILRGPRNLSVQVLGRTNGPDFIFAEPEVLVTTPGLCQRLKQACNGQVTVVALQCNEPIAKALQVDDFLVSAPVQFNWFLQPKPGQWCSLLPTTPASFLVAHCTEPTSHFGSPRSRGPAPQRRCARRT